MYSDPMTDFLSCLFEHFDFDLAQVRIIGVVSVYMQYSCVYYCDTYSCSNVCVCLFEHFDFDLAQVR
jgi:hypothetical protein